MRETRYARLHRRATGWLPSALPFFFIIPFGSPLIDTYHPQFLERLACLRLRDAVVVAHLAELGLVDRSVTCRTSLRSRSAIREPRESEARACVSRTNREKSSRVTQVTNRSRVCRDFSEFHRDGKLITDTLFIARHLYVLRTPRRYRAIRRRVFFAWDWKEAQIVPYISRRICLFCCASSIR